MHPNTQHCSESEIMPICTYLIFMYPAVLPGKYSSLKIELIMIDIGTTDIFLLNSIYSKYSTKYIV